MKTKVDINNKSGIKISLKRKVSKIIDLLFEIDDIKNNSALKGIDIDTLLFDIILTDDSEIHKINKEYRNKDCPTDVITFALFADSDFKIIQNKEAELGEIIISVETAKRQTKTTLEEEIYTLVTHGILHLLGFDHLTNADYNFVVGIQNKIIESL